LLLIEREFSVADIKKLENRLGVSLVKPQLLELALVHSSYTNENPARATGHNERLEFLGDAVLDLIVADKLYQDFPDITEGDMTRLRASLVRRETLARLAGDIDLGAYLFMGKGEESSGGRKKLPNLAGALEAVIAAIYLDLGMDTVRKMVLDLYTEEWKKLNSREHGADYKSKLQEITQSRFQEIPAYRLISETGPDHDKQFMVEVIVRAKVIGSGAGKSKKLAETEAARQAIIRLEKSFTE
jgi:ribonuclease-3